MVASHLQIRATRNLPRLKIIMTFISKLIWESLVAIPLDYSV